MKNIIRILFACLIFIPTWVTAQIPRTLSYQGILTDSTTGDGRNGQFSFSFRLYDTASGGTKLWEETKTLTVTNGLLSTLLGDTEPFGATVRFDKQYWMSIQVENEAELSPRIPLTSVGYSFRSLRADTANVSVASLADTTWQTNGSDIYRLNGKVGIGTMSPAKNVEIVGSSNPGLLITSTGEFGISGAAISLVSQGDDGWHIGTGDNLFGGHGGLGFRTFSAKTRMVITNGGSVGIGTTTPSNRLVVEGGNLLLNNRGVGNLMRPDNVGVAFQVGNGTNRSFGDFEFRNGRGDVVAMIVHGDTGNLDVIGRTKTGVLEITGGADLAEPFEISGPETLKLGSLVVIDPKNPGKLMQSTEPYDKRVAGVVSGAGGINPGLTLTQEGVLEGGQNVALSGRVYALATAVYGLIKPGDLLTTSDTPGHAMKATDKERWDGAIIGKAMSRLENGEGLVLVLVNLQ